jgi:hypothetical protein
MHAHKHTSTYLDGNDVICVLAHVLANIARALQHGRQRQCADANVGDHGLANFLACVIACVLYVYVYMYVCVRGVCVNVCWILSSV